MFEGIRPSRRSSMGHKSSLVVAYIGRMGSMKSLTSIFLWWCLIVCTSSAGSIFSVKVIKLDGLLPKLTAWEAVPAGSPDDAPLILNDAFKELGVTIQEGGGIFYSSGVLTCKLDDRGHERVSEIIGELYETEDLTAALNAYCRLLNPLTSADRLRTVLRIGFTPDPLVAQMIRKLRITLDARKPRQPTPFDHLKPVSEPLPAEDIEAAIADQEKITSRLLDISLLRLKEQLSAMNASAGQESR